MYALTWRPRDMYSIHALPRHPTTWQMVLQLPCNANRLLFIIIIFWKCIAYEKFNFFVSTNSTGNRVSYNKNSKQLIHWIIIVMKNH